MSSRGNKEPGNQGRRGSGGGAARWAMPFFMVIATVIVFSPAFENGFVHWDDDRNFLENPYYRGLGWTELRWMFTTAHGGHYQPLAWVTLGLDYLLWGMEPRGYHATNVLLHAANVVLFWFVSLRLLSAALSRAADTGKIALPVAAGFAGMVFSIHPLRVESVAWITARRDLLAAFFFLLTLLFYLRANADAETARARRRWMTAAVFLYALSLLSKAVGMTLPLVLLVLDVYPLKRLGGGSGKWFGPGYRRAWLEKIPFLLLAGFFGAAAMLIQAKDSSLTTLEQYGLASRAAQALFGVFFFLWKTVVPVALSPLYELSGELKLWSGPYLLGGLVFVGICLALVWLRKRWPAGISVWAYYLLVLAPVSGLAQTGVQITADRYSYLSCLGWALLAGAGLWRLGRLKFGGDEDQRRDRRGRIALGLLPGLAVGILGVLAVLTWKQAQVWRDSETLWRHVLTVDARSSIAHNSLGVLLTGRGKLEEAIEHYREALELDPEYAKAHNNLGIALSRSGRSAEARERFYRALKIAPAYAQARINLANVLVREGAWEEAMDHYRQAVRTQPESAMAHEGLARLLLRQGKREEAVKHLEEAVRLTKARSLLQGAR